MINRNTKGFYSILFIVAVFFLTSCTKHHADSLTAGGKKNAGTLKDSVIGSWRVTKVELPELQAKLSSFTSQTEKDDMTKKMEMYQAGLSNLVTTLKTDGTYESNLNGQVDLGTWTVTDKREVNTTSKLTNRLLTYEVVKASADQLIVKYTASDAVLLLTFVRK